MARVDFDPITPVNMSLSVNRTQQLPECRRCNNMREAGHMRAYNICGILSGLELREFEFGFGSGFFL